MWPPDDELLTAWQRLVADPAAAGPFAELVLRPLEADLARQFPTPTPTTGATRPTQPWPRSSAIRHRSTRPGGRSRRSSGWPPPGSGEPPEQGKAAPARANTVGRRRTFPPGPERGGRPTLVRRPPRVASRDRRPRRTRPTGVRPDEGQGAGYGGIRGRPRDHRPAAGRTGRGSEAGEGPDHGPAPAGGRER